METQPPKETLDDTISQQYLEDPEENESGFTRVKLLGISKKQLNKIKNNTDNYTIPSNVD